jgi:alpha-glucosidase
MMLLTLRGTPTLYYGDELGMRDVEIPPDRVRDPFEKNVPGKGLGRDPCRTPMQWDRSANAGFTSGTPWLPISDNYAVVNVETESAESDSMLSLYRRLIALRRAETALEIGSYTPVAMTGELVAYVRACEDRRFLIALNLGQDPYSVTYPDTGQAAHVVLSTYLDREGEPIKGEVHLRADEGVIIALHSR